MRKIHYTGEAQTAHVRVTVLDKLCRTQTEGDLYIHFLKIVEPHYSNVVAGVKPFEERANDRVWDSENLADSPGFRPGDYLALEHYPYNRSLVLAKVLSVMRHVDHPQGVNPGRCIMGIERVAILENTTQA